MKSTSAADTKKIAARIAAKLMRTKPGTHARVVTLLGDLGAGKTTFIQGFAHALGVKHRITSPTFVIMKRYPLKRSLYKNLYHLDAYRVSDSKELAPLEFDKVLADPENIILIEWANNLKGAHFTKPVRLSFRHGKKEYERIIAVKGLK